MGKLSVDISLDVSKLQADTQLAISKFNKVTKSVDGVGVAIRGLESDLRTSARNMSNALNIEVDTKNAENSLRNVSRETNKTTQQLAQLNSVANRASNTLSNAFSSINGTFTGLYASAMKLKDIFSVVFGEGLTTAMDIETNQVGMSGILSSMTTLNGEALKWNDAMGISKGIIKDLNVEAARTAATSTELISTFRALLGPGLGAGMTIEQIKTFTTTGVNAVKSLGLNGTQLVQELRDLVQGGIRPASSTLATALGLKDADITAARNSAEGLYAFLMRRLEGFKNSADATGGTLRGMLDQVKEAWSLSMANALDPFINAVKKQLEELKSVLFATDFTINPKFVKSLEELSKWLADVFNGLINVGKAFYSWAQYSPTVSTFIQLIKVLGKHIDVIIPLFIGLKVSNTIITSWLNFATTSKEACQEACKGMDNVRVKGMSTSAKTVLALQAIGGVCTVAGMAFHSLSEQAGDAWDKVGTGAMVFGELASAVPILTSAFQSIRNMLALVTTEAVATWAAIAGPLVAVGSVIYAGMTQYRNAQQGKFKEMYDFANNGEDSDVDYDAFRDDTAVALKYKGIKDITQRTSTFSNDPTSPDFQNNVPTQSRKVGKSGIQVKSWDANAVGDNQGGRKSKASSVDEHTKSLQKLKEEYDDYFTTLQKLKEFGVESYDEAKASSIKKLIKLQNQLKLAESGGEEYKNIAEVLKTKINNAMSNIKTDIVKDKIRKLKEDLFTGWNPKLLSDRIFGSQEELDEKMQLVRSKLSTLYSSIGELQKDGANDESLTDFTQNGLLKILGISEDKLKDELANKNQTLIQFLQGLLGLTPQQEGGATISEGVGDPNNVSTENSNKGLQKQADLMENTTVKAYAYSEALKQVTSSMQSGFSNAIGSWLDGTQSLGDAMKEMVSNITKTIAKLVVQWGIIFALACLSGEPHWAAKVATVWTFGSPTDIANGLSGNDWNVGGAATGGLITGAGTGTSDSIPTMLSNGEYVVKASSVRRLGVGYLNAINNGHVPSGRLPRMNYASGGLVGDTIGSDVGTYGGQASQVSISFNPVFQSLDPQANMSAFEEMFPEFESRIINTLRTNASARETIKSIAR